MSLRESLVLLSSRPEKQISYLIEIGLLSKGSSLRSEANIDELALQFEDEYLGALPAIKEEDNSKLLSSLENLNTFLEQLSGHENKDFWIVSALEGDVRWERVRLLAAKCLSNFRELP